MPPPMLADIRRQPDCLRALLRRAGELRALGASVLRPESGGALFAVACGDGWFAARASALAAAQFRWLTYLPYSSMEFLCYHAPRLEARDRVVAISMSGNVDRTVEAVHAAQARGARVLAVTNGDGGRIGQIASSKCSLEIPELAPFLCGTSTYTATILALLLLLEGTAGDGGSHRFALDSVPDQIEKFMEPAERFAREVAAAAAGDPISAARFLSAGPNLATVEYGAAKFVELTRIPSWSDDVEEFAHRQYWAMNYRDLVVYLTANARLSAQATHSAEALVELDVRTAAMELEGYAVTTAKHRLTLPVLPEFLSPLTLAVPLQLLSYHLAEATGLDPNTRRHLKEDACRFEVSRRLTRRPLVGTGR